MKNVKINLAGEVWKIKFMNMHATLHGECDADAKTIRINNKTPKNQVIEILIHECLHAIFPYLTEETVDEAAIELGLMLKKLEWTPEKNAL